MARDLRAGIDEKDYISTKIIQLLILTINFKLILLIHTMAMCRNDGTIVTLCITNSYDLLDKHSECRNR